MITKLRSTKEEYSKIGDEKQKEKEEEEDELSGRENGRNSGEALPKKLDVATERERKCGTAESGMKEDESVLSAKAEKLHALQYQFFANHRDRMKKTSLLESTEVEPFRAMDNSWLLKGPSRSSCCIGRKIGECCRYLLQIAGGIWADTVGGKQVLGFDVIWWSVATILTPVAAKLGLPFLLVARAFMGVSEGVAMPSMNNILSKWVHVAERSRSLALVYSGMYLGSVTGLAFSPFLIHQYGWPSVFYSFGSLGTVWFCIWLNKVLKFNLTESGLFCVLPWLMMAISANFGGWIADTLVTRGVSVTTVRKIMQTVGFLGPAFFLTQLSHIHSPVMTVLCMTCSQSGLYSNHQDIAPRYSGILLGLSNTAGVLAGVLGTAATGYILQHDSCTGLNQLCTHRESLGINYVLTAYKMFETIKRKPKINAYDASGEILEDIKGDVKLKDVYFRYPTRSDVHIFAGFSLFVPSGTTTALVGQSGSGKPIVISLLERFYDLDAGEVLIDGVNLKNLQLKWIRDQIGLVSQEPILFTTTIRENMAYGKEGATDEKITTAITLANAKKFINKLPQACVVLKTLIMFD
ncbi:hypothetical protein RYX36_009261 [Vicia faba]